MNDKRYRRIELTAFWVLIAAMSPAGYVYEIYNDTAPKVVLVPAILTYFLVCYLVYLLAMRLLVKR